MHHSSRNSPGKSEDSDMNENKNVNGSGWNFYLTAMPDGFKKFRLPEQCYLQMELNNAISGFQALF